MIKSLQNLPKVPFNVVLIVLLFSSLALGQTVENFVVTSANPQGWTFANDQSLTAANSSSGSFVNGPAGTPAGTGSAQLRTFDSTGGQVLAAAKYGGTRLADIAELKYWSYQNMSPQAIALQFNVDSDVTDSNNAFQGRLVFEPYQAYGNSAVLIGSWQEWDVLNGKWWGSTTSSTTAAPRPVSTACPQSNPCTTAQLLSLFPNVGILEVGGIYLKAGSGWLGTFDGNVDALKIGINTELGLLTQIWNFELNSVATDPEDCKKGGYVLFNPPTGPYKNQGQCVSAAVPIQ